MDIGNGDTGTFPTSSYPKLDLDSDEEFMTFGRLAVLHARLLLQKQDELRDLERGLQELDNLDEEPQFQRHAQRYTVEEAARRRLLKKIEFRLSAFNSMVLSMPSLRRVSKQSIHRGQTVREWIYNGPPILFDRSDLILYNKENYGHAATKLLNDSTQSDWLDDPIDQYWTRDPKQAIKNLSQDEGHVRQIWKETLKRICDNMIPIGGFIFWICHITAALTYLVIASTPEFNEKSSFSSVTLGRWLLGYWYVSAVAIVANEFLIKGYVYTRKIILGGGVACVVGFYVLYTLLHIPAVSAMYAFPTLFTAVLVLVKIM